MTGWVSVKERLPPAQGDYLTFSPHSYWNRQVHRWLGPEKAWEHEFLRYRKPAEVKSWVTHWMELPEAPAETEAP